MRLRATGAATAVGAVASIVAGQIFGLRELTVVGVSGVLVIATTGAAALLRRPELRCTQMVHPTRTMVGGSCVVELTVVNEGRRTPALMLLDPLSTGGTATLQLAPLRAGETVVVGYRLHLERRTVLAIGDLTTRVIDPFGFWSSDLHAAPRGTVVVHPRIEPLSMPGGILVADPRAVDRPGARIGMSEEFASLREYRPGDDRRHINWRATARSGVPIVRQFEEPDRAVVTVALDMRSDRTDAAGFERALSAAASVLVSAIEGGDSGRLVTSRGDDTGVMEHRRDLDATLDMLAVATPHAPRGWSPPRADAERGTLVEVHGSNSPDDSRPDWSPSPSSGLVIRVRCMPDESAGGSTHGHDDRRAEVDFTGHSLSPGWEAMLAALPAAAVGGRL